MKFGELKADAKAACDLHGWSNVSPGINWAHEVLEASNVFFTKTQAIMADTTVALVASTAEYTLTNPPGWIRLTDVLAGTDNQLHQITESSMREIDPLWTQADAGTPVYWWMSKDNTLRVHPKPDAAAVTATPTLYVHGSRLDSVMDTEEDAPSCPSQFHRAISLLAAYRVGNRHALGESRDVVGSYYKEALDIMDECRLFFAGQQTRVMVRRVGRHSPERIYLGGSFAHS